MKLVILDGHAVNPGDLSWTFFYNHADVTVYERTPSSLVAERIGDADAIFLNKINITKEILDKCPNLKYIGVLATGYNVVDLKAALEEAKPIKELAEAPAEEPKAKKRTKKVAEKKEETAEEVKGE